MTPGSTHFGIGVLADRTGLSTQVLRAWERRYGLDIGTRTAAGHRRFTDDDVSRVREIVDSRDRGTTLAVAIRAASDRSRGADRASVHAALADQHPELRRMRLDHRHLVDLSTVMEDELMARGERAVVWVGSRTAGRSTGPADGGRSSPGPRRGAWFWPTSAGGPTRTAPQLPSTRRRAPSWSTCPTTRRCCASGAGRPRPRLRRAPVGVGGAVVVRPAGLRDVPQHASLSGRVSRARADRDHQPRRHHNTSGRGRGAHRHRSGRDLGARCRPPVGTSDRGPGGTGRTPAAVDALGAARAGTEHAEGPIVTDRAFVLRACRDSNPKPSDP